MLLIKLYMIVVTYIVFILLSLGLVLPVLISSLHTELVVAGVLYTLIVIPGVSYLSCLLVNKITK